MATARYNLRHLMRSTWRSKQLVVCLWFMLAGVTSCLAAVDWAAPANELAHQIAALTGPGIISLSYRNNSSISADEVPAIRKALEGALTSLGVTPGNQASADVATTVQVTLSSTAQHGLWVAEVRQGPQMRVAMVTAPNPPSSSSFLAAASTASRASALRGRPRFLIFSSGILTVLLNYITLRYVT